MQMAADPAPDVEEGEILLMRSLNCGIRWKSYGNYPILSVDHDPNSRGRTKDLMQGVGLSERTLWNPSSRNTTINVSSEHDCKGWFQVLYSRDSWRQQTNTKTTLLRNLKEFSTEFFDNPQESPSRCCTRGRCRVTFGRVELHPDGDSAGCTWRRMGSFEVLYGFRMVLEWV